MIEIKVSKKYLETSEENEKFLMKAPEKSEIDFIHTDKKESFKCVDNETGKTVFAVIRNCISEEMNKNYYKAIVHGKAIQFTNNRGMATGVKPIKQIKEDGTKSNTSRVPTEHQVESSIIGYFDRYPRINYCRKTAWTQDNDDKFGFVTIYTEFVDKIFKENFPLEYEEQLNISRRTSPDFKIGKSVFTTITLNRNFRTHYHRDAGNLEVGLAAMSFIKTGKFSGGEIVMPNYSIGAKLFTGDLVFLITEKFTETLK